LTGDGRRASGEGDAPDQGSAFVASFRGFLGTLFAFAVPGSKRYAGGRQGAT